LKTLDFCPTLVFDAFFSGYIMSSGIQRPYLFFFSILMAAAFKSSLYSFSTVRLPHGTANVAWCNPIRCSHLYASRMSSGPSDRMKCAATLTSLAYTALGVVNLCAYCNILTKRFIIVSSFLTIFLRAAAETKDPIYSRSPLIL
jgi:hypothetical protein